MQSPEFVPLCHLRPVLWALAAVAATAGSAAHAAYHDISGGITFYGSSYTTVLDSYSVSGPVQNSRQVLYDDVVPGRSWHGRAGSGVDNYGVHASVFVGSNNIANEFDGGGQRFRATAFAFVSFTDFVISGPAGATSVITPINFHLSGEQILGSYTSFSGYSSSVESTVGLIIHADNNGASGVNNFYYSNGVASPPTTTGLLMDWGPGNIVTTPLWTLPVNVPFTLTLQLDVAADVSVILSDGYVTSALSDFGKTLSFATDRPVFSLPEGYSANSAEAGVVNNIFTAPVPEPASGVLAALGLLVVGFRARQRRVAVAAAAVLPMLAAVPALAAVQVGEWNRK